MPKSTDQHGQYSLAFATKYKAYVISKAYAIYIFSSSDSFLLSKCFLVASTTTLERAVRAIRFGIAIRALKVSASNQTIPISETAPINTDTT